MTLHAFETPHEAAAASAPLRALEQRPLVLRERDGQALLAAATRADVTTGGPFSSDAAAVHLWERPVRRWSDRPGAPRLLASVQWDWHVPGRHYLTVTCVRLTAYGERAGLTADDVLGRVLALAEITAPRDAACGVQVERPRPRRTGLRVLREQRGQPQGLQTPHAS